MKSSSDDENSSLSRGRVLFSRASPASLDDIAALLFSEARLELRVIYFLICGIQELGGLGNLELEGGLKGD